MKKSNIPDFSKKQPGAIKPVTGGAKAPPPNPKQVQKPPTKSKAGRRGG